MSSEAAAEMVGIDELVPWDENPRHHQPIDEIASSIDRFGFGAPIVARLADKRIIAGHTRWAAAKKLRLDEVPVRFMDLTEEEANALALADNKLGDLAQWDEERLSAALKKLASTDTVLDDLGWDMSALDDLLADVDANTGFLNAVLDNDDGMEADETDEADEGDLVRDGMVDFVVPMPVDDRAALHKIINRAKKVFGVSTTREAVLSIFSEFDTNHKEEAA